MLKNFVFFWKPNEKNGYLSQWYPTEMYVGGIKYVNCEQYMMAAKAMLFEDLVTYYEIMKETNPHNIKKLGRTVKNFNERIWNQHKERIIFEANYAKFTQNSDLQDRLVQETGDAILAEASSYDRIYGIGMTIDNPDVKDISKWGENILGEAIMKVRNCINMERNQ